MNVSRRDVLRGLSATPIALATSFLGPQSNRPALPAPPALPALRVDSRKLRERIETLSVFGRPAGGTFADGVSRTAYSDADVEGRRYVTAEMKAAGLLPHIDSVPGGGNFDGDLGSLSALGALEALAAAGVRTRHPLETVVWAHEESFA